MTILFEIPAIFEYIDLRFRRIGLINAFTQPVFVTYYHFAESTEQP